MVLSNASYGAVLLGISPAVVGLLVALAARQSGWRALGAVVLAVTMVLGVLGYAAWNALPPYKETPLITYVLLAVVPTALAAFVARALAVRSARAIVLWAAAVASYYVALVPTLIVSAYLLGPMLPNWLGCCPL